MKNLISTIFLLCVIMFMAVPASAVSNPWTSTFYFENDLFNGTDSNYTNGVKFSLISPNLSTDARDAHLPREVLKVIHDIPFIKTSAPFYTHRVEFAIGQNMYTPADIKRYDLITDDRPYSGWTYFSTSYHRTNGDKDNIRFMDTVEIQLGVVGPLSFAEESQKFIHSIRDLQRPNGWENQLKNEPGLAIAFERKWQFSTSEKDELGYSIISNAGGAIGNVYTYLNAGMELRLGWNIPKDFGVSIIRPAGSTRLDIGDDLMLFAFGAANGKAVARDIFLDGNTFTDSHSMDKNTFVADLAAGFAVNYNRVILTWTQVLRTKEFKGQKDDHSFGAIALSYSFPLDLSGLLRD